MKRNNAEWGLPCSSSFSAATVFRFEGRDPCLGPWKGGLGFMIPQLLGEEDKEVRVEYML